MPALDLHIAIVASFAVLLCAILDVARKIVFAQPSRKSIFELIALTAFSSALGAGAFWMGSEIQTVSTGLNNFMLNPNAKKLQQATPEKLAEVTRFVASREYLWRGVLLEHTTADGSRVLFQPSQDDLNARKEYVVGKTWLQILNRMLRNWAYIFWIMPVIAAGIGFLIGLHQKRQARMF